MTKRRPIGHTTTVARPWVDLPTFVKCLKMSVDDHEVNLVCQDTGLVTYTTPSYAWNGYRSVTSAVARAQRWMKRHGFIHGDYNEWNRVIEGEVVNAD